MCVCCRQSRSRVYWRLCHWEISLAVLYDLGRILHCRVCGLNVFEERNTQKEFSGSIMHSNYNHFRRRIIIIHEVIGV